MVYSTSKTWSLGAGSEFNGFAGKDYERFWIAGKSQIPNK
jgi:hypothetical protein